jgi:hypothetical protein
MVRRSARLCGLAAIVFGQSLAMAADKPAPSGEIQLRPFMAPVQSGTPWASKQVPISVVLMLADRAEAFAICELTPRIMDAMLESLYARPLTFLSNNELDTAQVEPVLLKAVSKALRGPRLTGLKVSPASEDITGKSSRSRATAVGCAEVGEDGKRKPH